MKCPECASKHPYKYGMKCSCGYVFLFNPKADHVSDGKFLAAIRRASANDTYFFTPNQLYAAYCRLTHKSAKWPLIIAIILTIAAVICRIQFSKQLSLVLGLAAIVIFVVAGVRALNRPLIRDTWDRYVSRWMADGRTKQLARMITKPSLGTPPPEWQETDIYDYGVERLLIVDRELLVDLFVLNGVHAEQRVLILAESGYPNYLLDVAGKSLRDNEQLPIFLLHDASTDGAQMERRVRAMKSLGVQEHRIIDLGLGPNDAKQMPNFRAVRHAHRAGEMPIDMLSVSGMISVIGLSFETQMGMWAAIEQQRSQYGDTGSFG